MKKYVGWISVFIALLGAALAGWVDFNNDEPQAAVLVILIVTIPLGMIQPGKAWLWATIVGLGLPAVYLAASAFGDQPASPPSPVWYASLLALIPAFAGAYAGALGRVIMKSALEKS